MSCIRRVSHIVNCGYARVAIYRNSNPEQNAHHTIDTATRATHFRQQFGSSYLFPEDYFEPSGKKNTNPSQFDRDCKRILDGFKSTFLGGGDRQSYLSNFSLANWYELSVEERKQHSLGNCAKCYEEHKQTQLSFPLKPIYHHQPIVHWTTKPYKGRA
jgi:hypothetical protein